MQHNVMETNTPPITSDKEKTFSKYQTRGSYHWREMRSKDPRVFNAYHQAHYDWIRKFAGDLRGMRVLDIGCGDGVLTYELARGGADVVGIDTEEHGLAFAEENLKRENANGNLKYAFKNASAYDMPFESESFDCVVCTEVIEHVQDPERLVREAHRVLKKGGQVILTTPYRLTEHPLDPHHVREYFPEELKKLVATSFERATITLTHHLFWLGLYTYSFPSLGRRPWGKWLINASAIYLKINPFMFEYSKPGKLDMFSTISVVGRK
jgi:ubiquinone biosynthesis O-methyltransferase